MVDLRHICMIGVTYIIESWLHIIEKRESMKQGGKEWSGMVESPFAGLETGDWTPISGLKGDYWCVSTLGCAATERHLKGTQRTTVLFLPELPIFLSILIGYVSVPLVRSDIDSFTLSLLPQQQQWCIRLLVTQTPFNLRPIDAAVCHIISTVRKIPKSKHILWVW